MLNDIPMWPSPLDEAEVRAHDEQRMAQLRAITEATGLSESQFARLAQVAIELNSRIERLFRDEVQGVLERDEAITDGRRSAFLAGWTEASDAADQKASLIEGKLAAGPVSMLLMSLQGVQFLVTFYDRFQKGRPEDTFFKEYLTRRVGPPPGGW